MDFFSRYIQIVAILLVMFPFSAGANEMIGNSARGYVGGDIRQEAGSGATNIIEVGSISGVSVKNSSAKGHVGGSITVRNSSGSVSLSIGSISSKK